MLLPNQRTSIARTRNAAAAPPGAGVAASVALIEYTLPGGGPTEEGPVPRIITPGVVDPCQVMCAGNPDPRCWSACAAARSPWLY